MRRAISVATGAIVLAAFVAPAQSRPVDEPVGTTELKSRVDERGEAVLVIRTDNAGRIPDVARTARGNGASVRIEMPGLKAVSITVPRRAEAKLRAALAHRPGVTAIEDAPVREYDFTPNDPRFSQAGQQPAYMAAVKAAAAWDVSKGDPSISIAIVDSGVDVNHPDLAGKWHSPYDVVTGSTNVSDVVGHGTFVAGVAAAATNNSVGIAGAGFNTRFIPIKVADQYGRVHTDSVAQGVYSAVGRGARVINISLGSDTISPIERDAVNYALGNGVVVVASAGNSRDTVPNYPAAYAGVIAVGATDVGALRRAAFSSYGPWVSVAAPGVDIVSTIPRGKSEIWGDPVDSNAYARGGGTSFSAPLVAGLVGLLAAKNPNATRDQLRNAVVKSGTGYANQGLGTGQVDFRKAFDYLVPRYTPILTDPVNGSTVSGVVTLTADARDADRVLFVVSGHPLGPPVVASGGVASMSFPTWGYHNAYIELVGCPLLGDCVRTGFPTGELAVQNGPPSLTAPTDEQALSGAVEFSATGPDGFTGSFKFSLDNVRVGFDNTAPYSYTHYASLADGGHVARVEMCSFDGHFCSPFSVSSDVTTASLHPTMSAPTRPVFSALAGAFVSTSVTVNSPEAGSSIESVKVLNAVGEAVHTATVPAGAQSFVFTWNGRRNDGTGVVDGTYRIVATTTNADGTVKGAAQQTVTKDSTTKVLALTGHNETFYPVSDAPWPAYKDTWTTTFTVGEPGKFELWIQNTSGGVVYKAGPAARPAGKHPWTWNGRTNAGAGLPAGKYLFKYRFTDDVGNQAVTMQYPVYLSGQKLVERTANVQLNGSAVEYRYASATCASASGVSSYGGYGVRLGVSCTSGAHAAEVGYSFQLPVAHQYRSLRADAYGFSRYSNSHVGVAFWNWSYDKYDVPPRVIVPRTTSWKTLGGASPVGHVSGHRWVDLALYVTNEAVPSDYDIRYVRMVVKYLVLA